MHSGRRRRRGDGHALAGLAGLADGAVVAALALGARDALQGAADEPGLAVGVEPALLAAPLDAGLAVALLGGAILAGLALPVLGLGGAAGEEQGEHRERRARTSDASSWNSSVYGVGRRGSRNPRDAPISPMCQTKIPPGMSSAGGGFQMRRPRTLPAIPPSRPGTPVYLRFSSPLGGRAPRDYVLAPHRGQRPRLQRTHRLPRRETASPRRTGRPRPAPRLARRGLGARPRRETHRARRRWAWWLLSPWPPAPCSSPGPASCPPSTGSRTTARSSPPRVYAADGTEAFVFARERRTVVPFDKIPDVVKRAVLAAEDAHFYEHEGVNYLAIARCAVKGLLRGRRGLRRLHHHPAGGEDLPAPHRLAGEAQGEGAVPRPPPRAEPLQGRDPLPLPEPDLPGAPALRRRGGLPVLLRQGRHRRDDR